MSDERFYEQVKHQFEGFSPEVPGHVYGGMRRKLWWSRFSSLDMHRFNVWYLLLFAGLASAGSYALSNSVEATAAGAVEHQHAPVVLIESPAGQSASEMVSSGSCASQVSCAESKACAGNAERAKRSQHTDSDYAGPSATRTAASGNDGSDGSTGQVVDLTGNSGNTGDNRSETEPNPSVSGPATETTPTGADTNTTSTPSSEKPKKRKDLRVPVYGNKK